VVGGGNQKAARGEKCRLAAIRWLPSQAKSQKHSLHKAVDAPENALRHGTPHIPVWDKGEREDGTFSRSEFVFDLAQDQYACPAGKMLKQYRRNFTVPRTDSARNGVRKYRASTHDCQSRELKARCCPNSPARRLLRSVHEEARDWQHVGANCDGGEANDGLPGPIQSRSSCGRGMGETAAPRALRLARDSRDSRDRSCNRAGGFVLPRPEVVTAQVPSGVSLSISF